ncbi:MAG TPA: extracellular solute-binding protein, partial [Chloroflexota bacterium]|nr:extracellular solute-binding protein [Chloroflexota bacterium]
MLRLASSLLILMALFVAGCGASTSTSSATTTLTVWYSTDDPVERIWSQQLARRFEATHPNVRVQFDTLSFEDINTKLQLALNAGTPPDLAYVTPRGPGIPVYVRAHKLLDLTAAAGSSDWAHRLRPGLLAAYNQPFSHEGARPGEIVAVPTALAAVGVLYNRRLLDRLHLAVPRTLTQLSADLVRAKAAGLTPIGMGNGDGWVGDDWYLTLVNSIVPPARLAPELQGDRRFSFLRPPFLQASTMLRAWAAAGYLTPDFGGLDAQEGLVQFFKGSTLFQLISSSENAQILGLERATRLPIGVFAFPGGKKGVMPQSGYLGWVVPAAARHRAAAISFIDDLLTPSTASFLLQRGQLPAVAGAGARGAT